MKRILVEMEKLKNPNSGLGQFCLHLGSHLQQNRRADIELNFYLPDEGMTVFGNEIKTVSQSPIHKFFPYRRDQFDVWHCIHQDSSYLPSHPNTKLILTIHDLNFIEKYKGFKKRLKLSSLQKKVNRANAITVISNYTEKLIRQHLQLNDKPVHVIPNGNPLVLIDQPKKPDFIHFHDFLFSIGVISKKKNFHVLLPLLEKNPHLHLVIAGNSHGDYADEILHLAKQLKVDKRLHFPGTVDNEQKNWLYRNCKAFVFPSLMEGFGLPVVEAMSVGAPVFLSDRMSLPEVGGPEAFYWHDFNPHSMNKVFTEGMDRFDSDRAKRSQEWAKQFSWEVAAQKYLELYAHL